MIPLCDPPSRLQYLTKRRFDWDHFIIVTMAGIVATSSIKIPKDLAKYSTGFSIDIGGSIIKIVYLDKDEWNHKQEEDKDSVNVTLKMVSFTKDDLGQAIAFIKKEAYVNRDTSNPTVKPNIYTTGVGSNKYTAKFREEFSVNTKNTSEIESFIFSLEYLMKNFSLDQVLVPPSIEGITKGLNQASVSIRINEPRIHFLGNLGEKKNFPIKHKQRKEYVQTMLAKISAGETIQMLERHSYPYMICQFGSGILLIKVDDENGSFRLIDLIPLAGRTFLDLGCILTGAESFEELISLAEKGNADNLNSRSCDIVDAATGDIYSAGAKGDRVIYSFGKLHGKKLSEVDKGDLACTLLQTICSNTVRSAHSAMVAEGCTNLFMVGSFVTNSTTQNILYSEFERLKGDNLNIGTDTLMNADLRMHIVQNSGWLGALGSFLRCCNENSQ